MKITLSRQDMDDIVNGATILGCGGGGPLVLGHALVEQLRGLDQEVVLVASEEVADDACLAVSAVAGSPNAALTGGAFPYQVAVDSFNGLQQRLDITFTHVLPGEVGAGNTLIPMFAAAKNEIPVVDASGSPRAMPTFDLTTFNGKVPISPIMIADDHTLIYYEATERKPGARSNAAVADSTARAILSSGTFPDFAGVSMFTMSGADLKAHGCLGTMSRAQQLGARLRAAKEGGDDPVEAVADELGGHVLFVGDEITDAEASGGGFDHGTFTLRSGHVEVRLIAQNETIVGYRSDRSEPIAISPDFLCYLTTDGQPFSNATADIEKYAAGKKVALIGSPATNFGYRSSEVVERWMSVAQGLGYGGAFIPIEELNGWGSDDDIARASGHSSTGAVA